MPVFSSHRIAKHLFLDSMIRSLSSTLSLVGQSKSLNLVEALKFQKFTSVNSNHYQPLSAIWLTIPDSNDASVGERSNLETKITGGQKSWTTSTGDVLIDCCGGGEDRRWW